MDYFFYTLNATGKLITISFISGYSLGTSVTLDSFDCFILFNFEPRRFGFNHRQVYY